MEEEGGGKVVTKAGMRDFGCSPRFRNRNRELRSVQLKTYIYKKKKKPAKLQPRDARPGNRTFSASLVMVAMPGTLGLLPELRQGFGGSEARGSPTQR